MSVPTEQPRDLAIELANLEMKLEGLPDITPAANQITSTLEDLYNQGAPVENLEKINDGATAMVKRDRHLNQLARSGLACALAALQERDHISTRLDTLQNAIETCDTDVPEILELVQDVQESTYEDAEMYMYEGMWEYFHARIADTTGLDESEADTLTSILTCEALDDDHPLWDELRAWMKKAEALLEGFL